MLVKHTVIASVYIDFSDFFVVVVVHLFVIRHFFAIPTNPGEQFFTFTSLAAWLFTCCGRNFEQPQEVCIFLCDSRFGSSRPLRKIP